MLLSLLFWEERRRQTLPTDKAIKSVRLPTVSYDKRRLHMEVAFVTSSMGCGFVGIFCLFVDVVVVVVLGGEEEADTANRDSNNKR